MIFIMFSKCSDHPSKSVIDRFEEKAQEWGKEFIHCYHTNNVTPYIHVPMMNHVHEFIRLHGSILPFTQQGLQKYNDITTKMYFRSSNHQCIKAITQMLEKQNHIEYLQNFGISSKSSFFEIRCSKCNQTGHNLRT